VALLFGKLVDIDISEEPPETMQRVKGAIRASKKKRS
jgi:hypothetical protein